MFCDSKPQRLILNLSKSQQGIIHTTLCKYKIQFLSAARILSELVKTRQTLNRNCYGVLFLLMQTVSQVKSYDQASDAF